VLAWPCACTTADHRDLTSPSLWRLTSPDGRGTATLLGSIHLGPAKGWRYPESLLRAFENATTLVVEVDVVAQSLELQQLVRTRGTLPEGQSAAERVPAETWLKVQRELPAAGISEQAASGMRPWLLSLLLVQAATDRMGYTSDRGVDVDFLQRSGKRQTIVALESAASQIALFDDMPRDVQALMLAEAVIASQQMESWLPAVVYAWARGDEHELAELFRSSLDQSPELAPFYELVVTQRNAAMSDRLEELLRAGGRYFVVVGALHTVSDTGIVATLRSRGFRTERIKTH
jgi:uncharacterized protein YbaP (TraB family)